MRALLVRETFGPDTAAGRAVDHLIDELERREIDVVISSDVNDAVAVVSTDPSIQCMLLDWDLDDSGDHQSARAVLDAMRAFNADVPIFLLADRSAASAIPMDAMTKADDFIWLLEDTADFIGGRVLAALQRYRATVLPPMFAGLVQFANTYEYSWHTPRAHRRHRIPDITGRPRLLRIFRREPLPVRPVDLCGRFGVAAGSHRADRGRRALHCQGLRIGSKLLCDQRFIDIEPRNPDGERDTQPGGAVRPELPQIG